MKSPVRNIASFAAGEGGGGGVKYAYETIFSDENYAGLILCEKSQPGLAWSGTGSFLCEKSQPGLAWSGTGS